MADAEELRAAAECKKARELTRPVVEESRRQPVGESGWESWNFDGRVRKNWDKTVGRRDAEPEGDIQGGVAGEWHANAPLSGRVCYTGRMCRSCK